MRRLDIVRSFVVICAASTLFAAGPDGNRLAYLDGVDPYYPRLGFARLTAPQWVGEEGVEAVVVLAIDDMRDNTPRYETYLRPILARLKEIDGRAPVSIMTCRVDPESPEVQAWLKEGLSIEVHTLTHPCPLLQKRDFAEARRTVHGGVDLIGRIPGNVPVAFRMPCCDSLNTPSPRFYAEIFNKSSPEGRSLAIDSSVFQVFTPDDPALPRDLVVEPDGRERFRKYIPFPAFVNTIENYSYPYVIGGLCWEFPCMVPSDWEAQHLQKPNNPATVRDMKAALDATVVKQGVFNLVFHPHNWIKAEQVVELIDHAVRTHGKKVKFLTFREAKERLDRDLLGGQPLRGADGGDNGVRILDLNNDQFMDVVVSNVHKAESRLWNPSAGAWKVVPFPIRLKREAGGRRVQFGVTGRDGFATMIDVAGRSAWRFDGDAWVEDPARAVGLDFDGPPEIGPRGDDSRDVGFRLRDLDGDGISEAILANASHNAVYRWSDGERRWTKLPFTLPEGARVVGSGGRDAGLRFVDLDADGRDDILFSNDRGYGVSLFASMETGWSRNVMAGRAGGEKALPKIVREDTDNGAWFHSRHLWVQNEDTATLPNLVDRRSFDDLLKAGGPDSKPPRASLPSVPAPGPQSPSPCSCCGR